MFHLQSGVNVVRDAACVLLLDDDRWAKVYFGTGSIGAIWLPKKVQLQSGLDVLPLALNHNAALQLGKDNNENNQNKTNKERPQKQKTAAEMHVAPRIITDMPQMMPQTCHRHRLPPDGAVVGTF